MFRKRSITLPVALGTVTVVVSVALLVGWVLLLRRGSFTSGSYAWLLVAGGLGLGMVATVLVLFSSLQVREILEHRRQGRFLDSVSHELKSPIASLRLCLDTLARPDLTAAQRERLHGMMREDVERLEAFVDDILAASRLEGERRVAERIPIALAPLVRRVADRTTRRHGLPPEVVAVDVPRDLRVLADPLKLEIVVRNLLDNAIKYSEHPVEVRVSADRTPDGRVALEVRDRGIGIPPDALRRVFGRFYRVPEESVRLRSGTGLGLYVCRALVRSMAGRLALSSEGPGRGTVAHLELPAAPAAALEAEA